MTDRKNYLHPSDEVLRKQTEEVVRGLRRTMGARMNKPSPSTPGNASSIKVGDLVITVSCGNATCGKGSDDECYLSLNPRDMDAAIDSHLEDEARRPSSSFPRPTDSRTKNG